MKFRTTLLLLGVFVVLGGYVLWSGRNQGTTAAATPTGQDSIPVLHLNPADVSALVVDFGAGRQVRVERSGADWKLVTPQAAAADTDGVNTAVDALSNLTATRAITPTSQ